MKWSLTTDQPTSQPTSQPTTRKSSAAAPSHNSPKLSPLPSSAIRFWRGRLGPSCFHQNSAMKLCKFALKPPKKNGAMAMEQSKSHAKNMRWKRSHAPIFDMTPPLQETKRAKNRRIYQSAKPTTEWTSHGELSLLWAPIGCKIVA